MIFEITRLDSLIFTRNLMRHIQNDLKRGRGLAVFEEKILKLQLLGTEEREFRDEEHRDKLLEQWFREAEILAKKFKEQEKKK